MGHLLCVKFLFQEILALWRKTKGEYTKMAPAVSVPRECSLRLRDVRAK